MRGSSERVGIIVANVILLVLNCPVASAAGRQPEAGATQDTVRSQRRLRDATPRRLTAPVAFDFSDQPGYEDAAYTIRPGWTIVPEFRLGEIYTDNIALKKSSETQDDFVTELKPGVQVLGNTRRLAFELNYNLQHLVHASNPELDDTFHRLFSSVNTELFEQLLFLDADTTLTQQNITTTGRGAFSNFGPAATLNDADDNINATGDREDVTTYRVSPYLLRRFGNFADAEVRFTYDDVSTSDTNADIAQSNASFDDSRSLNYRADMRSGSRYLLFPWTLTYENRQIDFDSGEPTKFEQIVGRLEYVYSPSMRLLGDLGYEKNSFESTEPIDDSIIWNIGGRWTPSARTTLEATYGKRFFGNQYAVNLSHQTKRTTWLLRYDEQQETVRDRQIERAVRSRGINIGPVDRETGDPVLPDGGIPTQTDDVFVRRLLSSGVVFQTERNQITLSVFDESRDFQSNGVNQSLFGATAIWTRRMSPVTNLDASFGWTRADGDQDPTTTRGSDDFINLRVQLQHWLGHSLLATIGYRRVELISDAVASEFTENRIFANLRMTF